jgi:PAS domain S-box-containing protein
MDKKTRIKKQIDDVLKNKKAVLQNAYSKSLEQLVEDLKIYQHELEFQNDELQRIHVDLENSKSEYQQLFQHAPVGYLVLDEYFRILDCNHTFRSLISYSKDCQKKMDFRVFIAPDYQDQFHFFTYNILKDAKPRQIEIQLLNNETTNTFVSIYGNVFYNNEVRKIRLTVTDINDRIIAQNALRKSEEELRTITENMTDMIVVSDLRGNIKYASPSCKFLGYTPDEFKVFGIFDLVHPEDADLTFTKFKKAIATKTPDALEFRVLTKSGKYIWVETAGSIIYNKEGEIANAVFVVRDITDRKQTEEQLLKTRELLHQTSQLARVGGWEIDIITNNLHWSEVTKEIHEVAADYQPILETGINFYNEGESREKIKQYISEAISSGKSFDDEFQIITAKGNLRWVRAMGFAEFNEGKCVRLYGVFQDIEEKRLALEMLKLNEKRLKELNETKDTFFSIIAHDLKSPFNSIMGFSEILAEQIQEKDYAGIEEYAKIIQDSSKRAMNLLMNILEWSRIQTGRISFNPENIDLNQLVDEIIDLLNDSALQKQITIHKILSADIRVFGDHEMLGTIFRNLISNAIKFTYPAGKITVSMVESIDNYNFSVKDNGVGIEPEHLAKLFGIGEKITTHGTENEKGTGLGLILCKEFIEKHGGKIWVKSEVTKGSTFSFSLPKTQHE